MSIDNVKLLKGIDSSHKLQMFLIPMTVQSNCVNRWHLKLRLYYLTINSYSY